MLAGMTVSGQQAQIPVKQTPVTTDLALTYAPERAQLAPGNCGCFWLQGGGADAAVTFSKGFGIATSLTGEHASNYASGISVSKIAYLAGPRYTYSAWTGHSGTAPGTADRARLQLFGQGLFGGVHAFDSVFPTSSGAAPTANSFALQAGGGLDLLLTKHIGVRLVEADYVRTALPNNAANTQNDLRLAFGVTYHMVRFLPRR